MSWSVQVSATGTSHGSGCQSSRVGLPTGAPEPVGWSILGRHRNFALLAADETDILDPAPSRGPKGSRSKGTQAHCFRLARTRSTCALQGTSVSEHLKGNVAPSQAARLQRFLDWTTRPTICAILSHREKLYIGLCKTAFGLHP